MALLSAAKAILHTNTKVQERLDRIETWKQGTEGVQDEFKCTVAALRDTLVACKEIKPAHDQAILPCISNIALSVPKCQDEPSEGNVLAMQSERPSLSEMPDSFSIGFSKRAGICGEGNDCFSSSKSSLGSNETHNMPDNLLTLQGACDFEEQRNTCFSLGQQSHTSKQNEHAELAVSSHLLQQAIEPDPQLQQAYDDLDYATQDHAHPERAIDFLCSSRGRGLSVLNSDEHDTKTTSLGLDEVECDIFEAPSRNHDFNAPSCSQPGWVASILRTLSQ
jgi:hypothetical protein